MYVVGFVLAVPKDKKEEYRVHAEKAAHMFKRLGATRVIECWQDDVPVGKKTDFFGAVKAKDDEAVLFSWIEYPSKEVRDAATKYMMEDESMDQMMHEMPFDGSRMIFGGFQTIVDV